MPGFIAPLQSFFLYFFGILYLKTIFYLPRVTAQTFRVFLQLFLDERVPIEMLKKDLERALIAQ